jgi:LmbE family N-acetylglucosaminyl deacetylase
MRPVLVVSPHLDDAVLSAGEFIAGRPGAVVVTMLAGAPDPPVTRWWDAQCGFETSHDAMKSRRAEDENALAELNATPVHLDFLDEQYGPASVQDLTAALIEQVEYHRPEFVVGPLGVQNPDHERVRQAVLDAKLSVPVWLYEDLPYSVKEPRIAAAAVESIRGWGHSPQLELLGDGPPASKRAALRCYRSQMLHLDFDEIYADTGIESPIPERFWRVS